LDGRDDEGNFASGEADAFSGAGIYVAAASPRRVGGCRLRASGREIGRPDRFREARSRDTIPAAMIEAVIWDFGGVLIRTLDFTSRDALASQLGLTREALEYEMFASQSGWEGQMGLLPSQKHWKALGEKFGLPSEELLDRFFQGDELDQELMDFIRGLRPKYKTGLLSNAFDTLRDLLNNEFQMLDAFDGVVISAEEGVVKPEPAIYELMLERLGVEANKAVFLDDFIENVDGARQVGMQAIHFQSREQALGELGALLKQDG